MLNNGQVVWIWVPKIDASFYTITMKKDIVVAFGRRGSDYYIAQIYSSLGTEMVLLTLQIEQHAKVITLIHQGIISLAWINEFGSISIYSEGVEKLMEIPHIFKPSIFALDYADGPSDVFAVQYDKSEHLLIRMEVVGSKMVPKVNQLPIVGSHSTFASRNSNHDISTLFRLLYLKEMNIMTFDLINSDDGSIYERHAFDQDAFGRSIQCLIHTWPSEEEEYYEWMVISMDSSGTISALLPPIYEEQDSESNLNETLKIKYDAFGDFHF